MEHIIGLSLSVFMLVGISLLLVPQQVFGGVIIMANITTGGDPMYMIYNPLNNYVYAINPELGTVNVINGIRLIINITIGRGSPEGFGSNAIFDPKNGYIYVIPYSITANNTSISVINGTKVIASISLPGTASGALLYDPANGLIYVTSNKYGYVSMPNGYRSPSQIPVVGYVTVINGTVIIANITAAPRIGYILLNDLNNYIYITDAGSNTVLVLNGTKVVANLTTGIYPTYMILDYKNDYVYVSNSNPYSQEGRMLPGTISVINDTRVIANITVGLYPSYMVYDQEDGYVYVSNLYSNYVSVINGTHLVTNVITGHNPDIMLYDPSNGYVYVGNVISFSPPYENGSVTVINSTRIIANITTGTFPVPDVYDQTNGFVYVINYLSGSITIMNGTTIVNTIVTGGTPNSALYNPYNDYVYVTNPRIGIITVLSPGITLPLSYTVTFIETGLPAGTKWSVTMNSVIKSSTTNEIAFITKPGMYTYTITSNNYIATPSSGKIDITGNTTVELAFSKNPSTNTPQVLSFTPTLLIIIILIIILIISWLLIYIRRKIRK